jgi:succinyl-diaminopimelate desuccinylase
MNETAIYDLISEQLDRNRNELIEFLQRMVRIDSVTPGPENRYDQIADCIKHEMDKVGLRAVCEKNNVIGEYKFSDNTSAFIFNGHMDTVQLGNDWTVCDPLSGEIINNNVYGRGAGDNKSAVAISVYSARVLKELTESRTITMRGRLLVTATNEEEVGGAPVEWPIKNNLIPASSENACLVGDGLSFNQIIHPCGYVNGCIVGRVTVTGRSCHGDFPQFGHNAIFGMNKIINLLQKIQEEKFNNIRTQYRAHPGDDRNYPYIFIGRIIGGLRFNIVPADCFIAITINTIPEMDVEQVSRDIETEIMHLAERENLNASYQVIGIRQPIIYDEHLSKKLISSINKATQYIYGEVKDVRRMGGTTDLTHFLNAGIPSMLLGAQSPAGFIHGADEHVSIESLLICAKLFAITAYDFLNQKNKAI